MKAASYEKVFENWLALRDTVKDYLSRYRMKLSFKEKDTILQYTPQQLQIPTGADIANYNVIQWATKDKIQVDLLEYFSLLSNNSLSYGPCQFFMQEIRDVFPDTSNDTTNKIVFADTQLWRFVPPLNEELAETHPWVDNIVKRIRPPGFVTCDELSSILIIANDDSNHQIGAVVFPKKAVIATVDPFNDKEMAKLVFDRLSPLLNVVLKSERQKSKTWKHNEITVPSVPYHSKSSCCGLLAVTNGIIVALSLEKSIDFFNHDDLATMAEQLAYRILRKMELKLSRDDLIQQLKGSAKDCSKGDLDKNDAVVDVSQNMDTGGDNDDAGQDDKSDDNKDDDDNGDNDDNDGTGSDKAGEDADDSDNSDGEKNKSVLGESAVGGDNTEEEQNVTHIYHEQQYQWMCAIHSLNNLLQAPTYDKDTFDSAADELLRLERLKCADLPGDGENGDMDPYSTEEGNYNFSVILQVLQGTEYSLQFVTPEDISTIGSDAHHAFLVSTEEKCEHFHAVRTLNGSFWDLNSFGKRPIRMKTQVVTDLCQSAIDIRGQGLKVWRLTPTPTPPTDAIPTELKSTIETVSWTDGMLHNQYWWSASFLQEMENSNSYTLTSLSLHCHCLEETGDQVQENISLKGDFIDNKTTLQDVIQMAMSNDGDCPPSDCLNKATSRGYTYVLKTLLLPTIESSRLNHLLVCAAVGEGIATINVDITFVGSDGTATNVSDKRMGKKRNHHTDPVVENTTKKQRSQQRRESSIGSQLFSIDEDLHCTYLLGGDGIGSSNNDIIDGGILYKKEQNRYLVKIPEEAPNVNVQEEEEEEEEGEEGEEEEEEEEVDEMCDYKDPNKVLSLGSVFKVNHGQTNRDTTSVIDIADHLSEICQDISTEVSGRQLKDTSILRNAILAPASKFVVTETDPIAFADHVGKTEESSKLMVQINVPNDPCHDLIKTLQCHMTEELFHMFMGSIEKAKRECRTDLALIVLQYMRHKHHICHQRFVLKYETVIINERNVAWLRQVPAPFLLLLKSPCALQTHAIVVWDGFVYDYQEKAPYQVTLPNFQHKWLAGGELYMIEACYSFFSHTIAKSQTVKCFPSVELQMEKLETCPFLMPKPKTGNGKKFKKIRKKRMKKSASR